MLSIHNGEKIKNLKKTDFWWGWIVRVKETFGKNVGAPDLSKKS